MTDTLTTGLCIAAPLVTFWLCWGIGYWVLPPTPTQKWWAVPAATTLTIIWVTVVVISIHIGYS